MGGLADAFHRKSAEFATVLKMGRTQLQDAVPMTLGQEFEAYAIMLGEDRQRLAEATEPLLEINLGGTAIAHTLRGAASGIARLYNLAVTGCPRTSLGPAPARGSRAGNPRRRPGGSPAGSDRR